MNFRIYGITFAILLGLVCSAIAQPNYFWNGGSGAFTDSSQWSFGVVTPAGPPAAGDRALFLSGGTFTVSGNGSPAQVAVQVPLVTFTGVIAPQGNVTGFPSLITGFDVGISSVGRARFTGSGAALNSERPITIGNGSEGSLEIISGATGFAQGTSTSASVSIAGHPAGIGQMLISETNSTFTATGTFSLGGRGIGTLFVTADGTLNTNGVLAFNQAGLNIGGDIPGSSGAQGTMNIDTGGAVHNELQTNIGLYGKGTVNISGGTFTSTDGGTDNPAISIARFLGSEGHLNVSGTGHVITQGELIVGGGDTGTMTITDEGLVETFARVAVPAIVGFGSDADGQVTIDGMDAQWTVTDALVVAQLGMGQVDIINGGTLFVESTDFDIDPYFHIGDDAGSTGKVVVSDEFSFLDASLITTKIGVDAFSVGRLEIKDHALANLAQTRVGNGGFGALFVHSGGVLNTGTSSIGELENSIGDATLDSNGSWHVGGQLYVGVQGRGELYVGENATLTVDEFISIGESPGGFGTMTIEGPTATVNGNLSALYIGYLGEGELYLSNAAYWTLDGEVSLGEVEGGAGAVFVDATSTWNTTGGIYVGGSAVASGGFGYLETRGTIDSETVITVWENGIVALVEGGVIEAPQVEIYGVLAGRGMVDTPTTVNAGVVSPDDGLHPTGRINFAGDYTQTAGGLVQIEIGGLTMETEYDQITIGGTASLQGALQVVLIDLGFGIFAPVIGDEFTILTAGEFDTVFGKFATENLFLPTLEVGLDWDVTYTDNELILTVIEATILPGDYNNDGIVNAADYVVWRDHLDSVANLPNDSTPGVDAGDYAVWTQNFGAVLGSGAGQFASVPEPTSMLIAALAIAGFRAISRRGATCSKTAAP